MRAFDIEVRVEVNGYDLGTVHHNVVAPDEDRANKLALNRQRGTLREQFPDATSLSVEVVDTIPTFLAKG